MAKVYSPQVTASIGIPLFGYAIQAYYGGNVKLFIGLLCGAITWLVIYLYFRRQHVEISISTCKLSPVSAEQFTMTCPLKNLELPNILICLTLYLDISYPSGEKGGRHASILCEMPCQKGNEGCQEHSHEEWQTRDTGGMPGVRY